jgi:predicted Zn-dependent protease
LLKVGEVYAEMGNLPKCEEAFRRAAQLSPGSSVILYNLAVLLAVENRPADSASNLVQAFAANDAERAVGAKVPNFRENARTNPIFSHIRQTPEFRAVLPEK